MRIAVLDCQSMGQGLEFSALEAIGEVIYYDYTEPSQVIERLEGVDVAVSNKIVYNQSVIESSPDLKLICMTGTGYNNIDLDAARQVGIGVCNVKDYCTESVAQHTFAMTLHLLNNLSYYQDYVDNGHYIEDADFKHYEVTYRELNALRWGIIGLGNIGRRVASLAEAFGCEIVYYSTSGKNKNQTYQQVTLETLFATSDIITIHAPLNESTLDLIDAAAINRMKKEVILVNVGRGGIINESDVCEAVLKDKIGGLGIDVFKEEPMTRTSPYRTVFRNKNVIITPHVAWASVEARQRVVEEVALNISAFLKGEKRNRVEGCIGC